MTKPALMTLSIIQAIYFYFNAKLTNLSMFSYQNNVEVTCCSMIMGYKLIVICVYAFYSCYGNHSCKILCKGQGCCLQMAIK